MGKEQGSAGKLERFGGVVRNGGIVAGLIGLLVSEPLLVAGIALAAGGELLRRSQKKSG
ncbi:hypothetical protein HY439_01955 [Candidatus Microgenomates bacterium]|nr:hypothetical protein [Candidatus Microgenomates bacterium]